MINPSQPIPKDSHHKSLGHYHISDKERDREKDMQVISETYE